MTYENVIKTICSRAGDKLFNVYRDVAGGYFISAIVDTIISGKGFTLSEILPLVEQEEVEVDGQGKVMLSDIDDLFEIIALSGNYVFKEITIDEANRSRTEDIFKPSGDELFWYRKGNNIFIDAEGIPRHIDIDYIKMPTEPDYADKLEYGIGFIQRMINLAVIKLKVDLGTMKLPIPPKEENE